MSNAPLTYTKELLIEKLKEISSQCWIPNRRHGNQGGIGNTLEDLLGIEENNLPIPNAAEWELKAQRLNGSSLTTLFHIELSPRAIRFVPAILLPKYGWKHKDSMIDDGGYELFGARFPEIAEKETRSITVMDGGHYGLPEGIYVFHEMFCREHGCDCRYVGGYFSG